MKIEAYFKRIGITGREKPNLAFLTRLMESHLKSVPFENLDIVNGRDIIIETDHIYKKVVENGRGGYCYELNLLFHTLLQKLGFDSTLVSGRVYNNKKSEFGPEFDHMAILVRLDQTYLVDVGFGESFRRPLPLGGEYLDQNGKYRILCLDTEKNEYIVEKQEGETWIYKYDFSCEPRVASDFLEMNAYQQTSPRTLFAKGVLCSISLDEGWLTLFGNSLIISKNGATERVDIPSSEMRSRIISSHFGLTCS